MDDTIKPSNLDKTQKLTKQNSRATQTTDERCQQIKPNGQTAGIVTTQLLVFSILFYPLVLYPVMCCLIKNRILHSVPK